MGITIMITDEDWLELKNLRQRKETFGDVIKRLLDHYKNKQGGKKNEYTKD